MSSTLVFSFDTTFELLVAVSATLIVLASFAIVAVLLQIERTKATAFASIASKDSDGTGTTTGTGNENDEDDLAFEESTTGYKQQIEEGTINPSSSSSRQKQSIEIELPGISSTSDSPHVPEPPISDGPSSSSSTTTNPTKSGIMKSSSSSTTPRRKMKRITWSFIGIQIISVLSLILLTYLILVVSDASIALRLLGALCVFFIYLRFQIGDEIRRQRIDRILLLVSLFLVIASMLSLCIYSFKTLRQGEVYEGPARIVGYDMTQYNNSQHDPTTRTDIAVSWGKSWGCPLSGGKVCQARIEGAMCQVHPEDSKTRHKSEGDARRRLQQQQQRQQQRTLTSSSSSGGSSESHSTSSTSSSSSTASSSTSTSYSSSSMGAAASAIENKSESNQSSEVEELEEDLEDEENEAQTLEEENDSLKATNAELEKEVEELKEENAAQQQAEDAIIDEADSEIYEVEEEYAGEVMEVEGQEYEDAEYYEDQIHEEKKNELEQKLNTTDDPNQQAEIKEEIQNLDSDEQQIDEEYEEVAEEYEEYADEYMDEADTEWDNALDAEDKYEDAKDEEEELADEVDATEELIDKEKDTNNYGSSVQEEEEEIVEEYEEEIIEDEEWYWDEIPDGYDDDYFEDEYWDYDWDSVWGEYACEDLFDDELGARTYDPNTPAGGDDEWPFVMIYGSCKTCDAYILDYFAEEAFEEVEDLKQQAIIYLVGAVAGLTASLVAYLQYRVSPTPANQVELLGYDGGVLA